MLKKFQYDLFVIGGGAGGLASSKASALLGKKVGMADFATPSPHATTWGTGDSFFLLFFDLKIKENLLNMNRKLQQQYMCMIIQNKISINVGCVPTKLMPFSARMGEIRKDQIAAGFSGIDSDGKHNWQQLIETVQKHIKELNVRQESSLKDHGIADKKIWIKKQQIENIDYYNKFAKFIDRHTIEVRI